MYRATKIVRPERCWLGQKSGTTLVDILLLRANNGAVATELPHQSLKKGFLLFKSLKGFFFVCSSFSPLPYPTTSHDDAFPYRSTTSVATVSIIVSMYVRTTVIVAYESPSTHRKRRHKQPSQYRRRATADDAKNAAVILADLSRRKRRWRT